MNVYKCLIKNSFEDQASYKLVPIREEDLESIRLWRNAQMDVLRQRAFISAHEQHAYYHNIIWPTFVQQQPKQVLFSYLYRQTCIGYGGLTHLDWEAGRGEVSFLLNPQRVQNPTIYEQDFIHFLNLLFQVAFEDLNLHRLFTETFAFREVHIQILEKCGFKQEGVLRDHIYKGGEWHHSLIHGCLTGEDHFHA
jgi:RimJ/RimL family protein N-acetyltransferase